MNKFVCSFLCLSLCEILYAETHDPGTSSDNPIQDIGIQRPEADVTPKPLKDSCVPFGKKAPFSVTSATEGGNAVEHHYGPFARIVKQDFENGTKEVLKKKVGPYPILSPKGGLLIHANGDQLELMRLTSPPSSRSFLSPYVHKELIEHNGPASDGPRGAFSEDEKTVVLKDHSTREWLVVDVNTEEVKSRLRPSYDVDDVRLSKDGRRVALFESTGRVSIWDADSGRQLMDQPYGKVNQSSPAAFSSDGNLVAVAREPGDALEVLDATGESRYTAPLKKILNIQPEFIGRSKKPKRPGGVWAQFLPSPSNFLVAGVNGREDFVVLNERGKVVGRYRGPQAGKFYGAKISSDGRTMVVNGQEGVCQIELPQF